jgi:hypothetical protein
VDDLSASAVRRFEKGLLNLDEDGSFTYKPRSNFYGDDSFTYEVSDSNSGADTATVRITVKNNDPPTADAGGPYDAYEGAPVTIGAFGSDPEGEALIYKWDLDGDGFFETPGTTYSAANLEGPSSYKIRVRVTDTHGESSVAEGPVDIKPSIQPPPKSPAPRMCQVG